ncbi:type 2 isopentenyl-diphosphate Delta-isomerase [Lyngbya confervoides]|uniref:Isopentenyl-diphosphate delta-isomerase n=1 Tax=Lyngbya confervoides BDU141951 TaxID=1574623 RepID=A0ABD4T6R8_9CYAN|nr:type 2 isopentenyl-diphosphate Delta-isomerase [Lyngbya confervoides]MCM1984262.1 type 2 isopentenyl-diphosphate Delta-isomerase [Lyngbya confervoides BDU141951]
MTSSPPSIQTRKADHIRLCLEDRVQCQQVSTGLERFYFRHTALPELDFQDISLTTTFLGKPLQAPLLISSMTGGTALAEQINQRLAIAAQTFGIAMGVGSQRVAIEHPDVHRTFAVRSLAPDIPLFANLGAVQLNYGYGLGECQQVVDLLEADALFLHLNPLQECIQSRGDTNFHGLLGKIAHLCQRLSVPVIVKEVGNGISAPLAQQLKEIGVAAIDVAGAGGTSWAKVEGERGQDHRQQTLGQTFAEWGIPTADCLMDIRQQDTEIPLIASGGLRNGLDVAKAIALGANLGGMATPFLKAAYDSEAALHGLISVLLEELKITLFCTGSRTITDLQTSKTLCPTASGAPVT